MVPDANLYQQALDQFNVSATKEHAKDDDVLAKLSEFLRDRATPQSAKKEAEELQKDASKKFSTKKVRGKEVLPEKWIANVMVCCWRDYIDPEACIDLESIGQYWKRHRHRKLHDDWSTRECRNGLVHRQDWA
jgi:hypothetical protein